MIKCLIVEDEVAGQYLLQRKIKKYYPSCHVEKVIDNLPDAVEYLNQHKDIDLVFMDVQIKGGTGLDVLQEIQDKNFETIFITAYPEFAIQALNKDASYYLLKPIHDEEFVSGMDAVLSKIQSKKGDSGMFVSKKGEQYYIYYKDLICLESDGAYTHIYTTNERLMSSKNLGYYEKSLPENIFVRTHHSYIINAQHIKKLVKNRGGMLTMTNDMEVPVAQRRMADLQHFISD